MTATSYPDTLTDAQRDLIRAFPAKYSAPIVDAIEAELAARFLHTARILDPFGGVGGVHQLADRLPVTTVAIDIEAEQAALHPRTVHGDSRRVTSLVPQLRALTDPGLPPDVGWRGFDAIVTSPAYGNRLADQYLGSDNEKCRRCDGQGWLHDCTGKALTDAERADGHADCSLSGCPNCTPPGGCGGTGKSPSKRMGYAIALGRRLTLGSGAALHWGDRYRKVHRDVLREVQLLLRPGGWWLVNVSSFLETDDDGDAYRPVMEWWVEEIAVRARIVRLVAIPTARLRFGQNAERRVPVEHLIVAQARG